jgi:hypothetical protein
MIAAVTARQVLGVLLDVVASGAQHLFRVVFPDVLGGGGGDTDAVDDGAVIPGLAHAVAVHVAHAHVGHHLGRRHGDDLGALHRVDAVGRHPVVQPHGVRAGREGLRKGVLALVAGHQFGQAGAVNRALVGQLLRQRNGLAVVVERHQHGHVLLGATDADVDPIDQAVQHMGKVQFSVDQLVAHAGPAGFLRRDDLDAVFLVNAQHRGHDHAGAVGQRDEADLDFLLLGGVGALCVDGGAQRGVDAHGPTAAVCSTARRLRLVFRKSVMA